MPRPPGAKKRVSGPWELSTVRLNINQSVDKCQAVGKSRSHGCEAGVAISLDRNYSAGCTRGRRSTPDTRMVIAVTPRKVMTVNAAVGLSTRSKPPLRWRMAVAPKAAHEAPKARK